MKRFVLAAVLALVAHGLFFAFGPWKMGRQPAVPSRPLTMTFSTKKAPTPGPEAAHPAPAAQAVPEATENGPEETPAPKPPPDEEISRPPEKPPIPVAQKAPTKPPPRVDAKAQTKKVKPPPKKKVPKPKERPVSPAPAEPEPKTVPEPAPVSPPAWAPPAKQGSGETRGSVSGPPGPTGKAGPQTGEEAASAGPAEEIVRAVPAYRDNPRPDYPRMAKRRGYEGTVILEVLVNRAGRVEDLRILASSGHDVLDRAAMKSVREWLFEPGSIGGRKVDMWVRVPVRFELRER